MKVHEVFADALLQHGADVVFGLMGDANLSYLADYRDRGGRFVAAVHEGNAVGMADAWHRRSGRIGVASITHGPALTNSMTSLVEAVRAGSRMVVVTGSTPLEPTHFQRLDLSASALASGAGFEVVTKAQNVVRHLNRALQRTVAENRPIVLDLPIWMIDADAGDQRMISPPQHASPQVPDPDSLDEALGLLSSTPRPVVLAGRGAYDAGAKDALIELAERIGGALATTLWARDLFAGHPSNIGIYGNLAHSVASSAIGEATCVIAFGASLNPLTTYRGELTRGKKIIQVDTDPGRFGWFIGVDEPISGDAKAVAEAMNEALTDAEHEPSTGWISGIQAALAAHDPHDDFRDISGVDTVDMRSASIVLDELLPAQRTVVADVGRYIRGTLPFLAVPEPRNFVGMGAFGSIGLGLAGAIGAAVAASGELTALVVGDGGLMMNFAEFSTAVRERLPLVVLTFDDGAYGAEWDKLVAGGSDPLYSTMVWPDFADLARAFGGQGLTVRTLSDLDGLPTLLEGLAGPLLVDIRLDPAAITV
ncbi:thiamine pyrophosphate-binding protein [Herbiconiux daphne]|uniref:Thiamine pyrophosphate-binding protein n=1 Tax=Herbiconiux daphne TaxID=2970914 RepID=A0ABT2H3L9_9MICO|nr:thiamine pyrophosphate-binding protein [Herbiconiux daphne]MCS5734534.1 thiamine pyrophosphate-binding protein [Herbiconiux daphne]